jgi:hypothetical protein
MYEGFCPGEILVVEAEKSTDFRKITVSLAEQAKAGAFSGQWSKTENTVSA